MTVNQYGPKTKAADALHAMKYRTEGESFREAAQRVAFALKDDDRHYHELREILLAMRFMPAGRVQNAMGASRMTTPYNCFVSGTIADSYVEGSGSIMARAHEAAATMRMGGGIGYDFSTLRPRGFMVSKLGSQSTGPVSFMDIFNAVCLATSSSGHRRGAQMGVMRVDHPDIEEFVRAKQNEDRLRGFNLSIAVTDEFMEAALSGKPFRLRWQPDASRDALGEREIDAAELWEKIMRSTWDWAEPGVIFIDRVNRMNNLYYAETIAATNPCGEQPLPPYGACLLGSINLPAYLVKGPGGYSFDYDLLKRDIPIVVRGMDNVVDRARYPLPEQRVEAVTKRRMGIGVMGLANALEALGYPYGAPEFLALEGNLLAFINAECYRASVDLAREKGSFPRFDVEKHLAGEFVRNLPEDIVAGIRRYGIRNSHLTSIAPTGTISMCCDNVSGGIEPVFSYVIERPINTPDGTMMAKIEDYGYAALGVSGKRFDEVSVDEHVDVLVAAQRHVDSSVSKTCNVPSSTPWASFKDIYRRAWEEGAKSCSTFTNGGRRGGLLSAAEGSREEAACTIDPETGIRSCE